MRWSCGVFCGFVLALLLGAAAFYFFYLKENPDAAAEGMEQIEQKWENTKKSGDKVIDTIKPFVPQKTKPENEKLTPEIQ